MQRNGNHQKGNCKLDGIINLYKPKGYTSHDAVARIKRFCGTRRVGHAGTLDPMATGVLPILVGKAAAAQEYLMNHDKTYIAGMRFGITTDTGDITGNVLCENPVRLTADEVMTAANKFVGRISQVPPMYSAIKKDGKKLYELAREGITVEREARQIEIYHITPVETVSETDFLLEVSCSKGTYIRTLCEDIGKELGCGGALFSLERTRCGEFYAKDAVTLEQLEQQFDQDGNSAMEKHLVSAEKVFSDKKAIRLPSFYSRLCKNGCEIYIKKLKLAENFLEKDELVRLYDQDGVFFALAKAGLYKEGFAVKAVARFAD